MEDDKVVGFFLGTEVEVGFAAIFVGVVPFFLDLDFVFVGT